MKTNGFLCSLTSNLHKTEDVNMSSGSMGTILIKQRKMGLPFSFTMHQYCKSKNVCPSAQIP